MRWLWGKLLDLIFWNIWLGGLLFVGGGVAVLALLVDQTTLICTRGDDGRGECRVETFRLVGATTRRFPVADLRGGQIRRDSNGETYTLEVQTAGRSLYLRPESASERSMRLLANRVDDFAQDGGRGTLRVRGRVDPGPVMVGGGLVTIGGTLLAAAVGRAWAAWRRRSRPPVASGGGSAGRSPGHEPWG